MARRLPPFAALRAFEAAARLGTQAEAAGELRISTSAISHQIQLLEAFLGVKLFVRSTGRMTFTDEGKTYLAAISSALDQIEGATAERIAHVDVTPLRLHMYQSLANLWLIPHLRSFIDGLPDQRVAIVTHPDVVNLTGSDIDAAIVYGREAPRTGHNDHLFAEVMSPICSPDFVRDEGPIASAKDLLERRLIGSSLYEDEWTIWFDAMGVKESAKPKFLVVDNRSNALQAAREGLGVAMDRRPFGEWPKSQGHLLQPVEGSVGTGFSYWLHCTDRSCELRRTRQFRTWLKDLCARSFQ